MGGWLSDQEVNERGLGSLPTLIIHLRVIIRVIFSLLSLSPSPFLLLPS